jgi:hypothetical protein
MGNQPRITRHHPSGTSSSPRVRSSTPRRPRGVQQLSNAAWQQVRAAIRELTRHPAAS